MFNSGIKKGRFREEDPYLLAIGLDGMLNSFLFQAIERPGEHPFEPRLVVDLILRGILLGGEER